MGINIKIESPSLNSIAEIMLDAVAEKLDRVFKSAGPSIAIKVGLIAKQTIKECPEYLSLINGDLRGQLGVIDAKPILDSVCENIANGILVTSLGAKRVGLKLSGGLRLEMLKGDYSEVLSVSGGSFVSEHGYQIDWLKWLTLEGDRIIVADYGYYSNYPLKSRTGLGIMKRPGVWRVPPEFSGTDSDNFITRALGKIGPGVEQIIDLEVKRHLN